MAAQITMEVVQAAIVGETSAQNLIYRRMLGFVTGQSYKILRYWPNDQEDAVQEAMMQLFNNLDKYRGESAFTTWAYRVVQNHLIMTLRKLKRGDKNPGNCIEAGGQHDDEDDPVYVVPDTRDDYAAVDARIDLERILPHIPAGQREMLLEHSYLGLAFHEMSANVGCAKSQHHRALKRARKLMEEGVKDTAAPMPTVSLQRVIKFSPRHCACGCGTMFTPTGARHMYLKGHAPAVGEALAKPLTASRPPKVVEAAPTPNGMVTLSIPVTSLDKMFSMLPADVKARAIERFLQEV